MENSHEFLTENKYPTLSVKNFGKISEAHIELAPFTVFIGDNNSGKSYLLNLLWGLQKESFHQSSVFSFFRKEWIEEENAYKNLFTKIESFLLDTNKYNKEMPVQFPLCSIDINNIMTLINTLLNKNKDNLIKSLFATTENPIPLENVTLHFPLSAIPKITYFQQLDTISDDIRHNFDFFLASKSYSPTITLTSTLSPVKYIIQLFVDAILFFMFPSRIENNNTNAYSFFPTARTGFLLTYKEVSNSALFDKYGVSLNDTPLIPNTKLLQSTLFFIKMLTTLDATHNNSNTKKIVDFMERDIIDGTVTMHSATEEFFYKPKMTDKNLKMHMSSAVVTEIAPLLLYLKYQPLSFILFMEEPEISLHPKLQEKITRVLIKLLNSCNQQIFISTHSDTITQHINNMIKLGNNPLQKQDALFTELGYDKNDALKQEDVRMYQFDVDSTTQKTTISSLASSPYGFRTPTFGDFLSRVGNQIDTLLEDLEL